MRIGFPDLEKPGERIGPFKLLQLIGEGGMGSVWMAEQEKPVRRRVALKVIKLGMDTKQVIGRFEAERQALALMDHPNIAKVLDAGATESGRPFFAMELVKGVPITKYCDDHKLNTEERLKLFTDVCHAIQHAHQKGIIHRDIKPSNILVTLNDGVPMPKVIDFGIAKATGGQPLTDKTVFTALEQFIGTPAYMSPEQAEMNSLDIDTRSDIYALGVLLYELLTGKTPFDAKELVAKGLDEIRRIIREKEPPRPSTRLSTLDAAEQTVLAKQRDSEPPKLQGIIRGDLDWIVMKTLEKDRTRRYDTANGLAMDILRYLNNEPIVARPPSQFYRLKKTFQRNKLIFAAATAVIAALALGFGTTTWMFFKERAARKQGEAAEALSRGLVFGLPEMLDRVGDLQLRRDLYQRIADYYRRLDPDRLGKEPLRQYVGALSLLGDSLMAMGEQPKAIEAYSQGLRILLDRRRKRVADVFRSDLIVCYTKVADVAKSSGDSSGSRSNLLQALALARELVRDNPDNPLALRPTSGVLDRLCSLEEAQQNFVEAVNFQREALEISRRIAAKNPEGWQEQSDVASDEAKLAQVLSRKGEHTEALRLAQSSVASRRRLLSLRSDDAMAVERLLGGLDTLTEVQVAAGRLAEVEPFAKEQLQLAEQLTGRDPTNLGWQRNLAICHDRLTRWALQADRLPVARQHAEKALAISEALAARDKKNGRWQSDLAVALGRLAKVQAAQDELDAAIKNRERSLGILQQLAMEQPESLEFQTYIANAAGDLAAYYQEQGPEGVSAMQRCHQVEHEALSRLQAANRLLPGQSLRLEELTDKLRAQPTGPTGR